MGPLVDATPSRSAAPGQRRAVRTHVATDCICLSACCAASIDV